MTTLADAEDGILYSCNETELITMYQRQTGLRLRRGLPKADLVLIVGGYADPHDGQLSDTANTRLRLEATIKAHIEVMRSQLPGCDGRCTTYPCSDGRHSVCFSPNEPSLRP